MSKEATLEDLNKVWEVNVLTKMKDSSQAKALLERIAHEVSPLMKRRKWKVLKLNEFFPNNPSLQGLNVNRGQSIMIRMRPPNNANLLYPYEHVMGTMIHELTHMQIGPHDSSFYKLMEEIENELNNDLMNHIPDNNSIMPFSGKMHRLGGKFEGNVSKEKLSSVTAEAARRRQNHTLLASGSGQKLGGSIKRNISLSPEELKKRALAAAERRLLDDKWCPSNQILNSNDIRKQQDSNLPKVYSSSGVIAHNRNQSSATTTSSSTPSIDSSLTSSTNSYWSCELCTTRNSSHSSHCQFCGAGNPAQDVWICQVCTLINEAVTCACGVCGNVPGGEEDSSGSTSNKGVNDIVRNYKKMSPAIAVQDTVPMEIEDPLGGVDNDNNSINNCSGQPTGQKQSNVKGTMKDEEILLIDQCGSPVRKRRTNTSSLPTTTVIDLNDDDDDTTQPTTKVVAEEVVVEEEGEGLLIPCLVCTYLNTLPSSSSAASSSSSSSRCTMCTMCGSTMTMTTIADNDLHPNLSTTNVVTKKMEREKKQAAPYIAPAPPPTTPPLLPSSNQSRHSTTTILDGNLWACEHCTLLNDGGQGLVCAACGLPSSSGVAGVAGGMPGSSSSRDVSGPRDSNFVFNPYKPMFH